MHGRPISRILFQALPPFDDHSSKRKVTPAPLAANPDLWAETSLPHAARGPYSALLPVGLAMPVRLPVPRWALTPPFHPYLACKAVCSLWRCPSGCPARALPGTVVPRSPDFPRRLRAAAIQPSVRASPSLRGRQGQSPARSAARAQSVPFSGPRAP